MEEHLATDWKVQGSILDDDGTFVIAKISRMAAGSIQKPVKLSIETFNMVKAIGVSTKSDLASTSKPTRVFMACKVDTFTLILKQ